MLKLAQGDIEKLFADERGGAMTDRALVAAAASILVVHFAALPIRRTRAAIPALNIVMAAGVIAYLGWRIGQGFGDQAMWIGLLLEALGGAASLGWNRSRWCRWAGGALYAGHLLAAAGALLFALTFRITRLI